MLSQPGVAIYYSERLSAPVPKRGTAQRWNTPGYRHCQTTDAHGNTRTWISKEPSWGWIETTGWVIASINKEGDE